MGTHSYQGGRHDASLRHRPTAKSAAVLTATAFIVALFSPVPALATPQAPLAPAVPDIGSRPIPLGTLTMPGQPTPATPVATPLPNAPTSPMLRKIEKGRAEIATLGDRLIVLGQERDLARGQNAAAQLKYGQSLDILQQARAGAADAAAASMRRAAAAPPGADNSGLVGLDDLARLQRGSGDTQDAVARQLTAAQVTAQFAFEEQTQAEQRWNELAAGYDKLKGQIDKRQAAQQALELRHADELSAAESTETAADSALAAKYLTGAEAGRGADPRAIKALEFALAQRGDPYLWSAEGPNHYDCSGLTYTAYRSVGYPLMRVSRDQYRQTSNKVVDRYSLLPGDLLFFSYSNSWTGIHHVAMYAGDGMMVEAPRTGLNVRLVPVRWSRLFEATRVFGSVDGDTEGPDPDPDSPSPHPTSPAPTPSRTPKPSSAPTSKPSSSPTPSQSTSPTPTPSPSPQPSTAAPIATPSTSPTASGGTSSPSNGVAANGSAAATPSAN